MQSFEQRFTTRRSRRDKDAVHHCRQHRSERLISKRDLRAAVKYGVREPSFTDKGELRWMYTFRGIVYITDETSRHEITSWPLPAFGFDVPLVDITQRMLRAHRAAKRALGNPASWTSHTVAVVDQVLPVFLNFIPHLGGLLHFLQQ